MRIARKFDFNKIHMGLNQTFDDLLHMLQNLDKLNFKQYPDMNGVELQNLKAIDLTSLQMGAYTISTDEMQYIDGLDQALKTTDSPTFDDLTITTPVNIYGLSHDSFTGFVSNEHVAHAGTNLVSQIADRILTYNGNVVCHDGDIVYA